MAYSSDWSPILAAVLGGNGYWWSGFRSRFSNLKLFPDFWPLNSCLPSCSQLVGIPKGDILYHAGLRYSGVLAFLA